MSYTSSPRPTYERAAHIPHTATAKHLWGDAASGEVADWIYVSSDKIHQLVFGLPSRGFFRHSEAYRTIFAADVLYYVLSGAMAIANPERGEVHRVLPGEAAFFRRDTWHHVYNYSVEPLRVLELFAPPPSQGTSGAYARTKPYLAENIYAQDEWLGQVPVHGETIRRTHTIQIIREADYVWRLEGAENLTLVGLICSTEHLTACKVSLQPGQHTDIHAHGGDESLYVLDGTLHMRVHDGQRPNWFEVRAGDGFYVPQDVDHQCYNVSEAPVTFICGVAPEYLPHRAG